MIKGISLETFVLSVVDTKLWTNSKTLYLYTECFISQLYPGQNMDVKQRDGLLLPPKAVFNRG